MRNMISKKRFIFFSVGVCCLFISSAVMLIIPYGIGRVIDIIYKEKSRSEEMLSVLSSFCAVLVGVIIVGGIANAGRVYIILTTGE